MRARRRHTTSSCSAPARPASTAPARSPKAGCASRSSSASWSAASARTGRASRPRRCCARARRCRARARRRATAEVDVAPRWRGATSWSPTTPTPARRAGSTSNGIDVLRGTGRLAGPGRRRGRRRAAHRRARRARGRRRPVHPADPGLRELDGVWSNREATSHAAIPRRLVVLGGGAAGVELAQAVRRLGGEVALVESAPHLLAREPAPLGEALGDVAAPRRHRGRRSASRRPRARREGDDYVLELADGRELRGERLLVATGRRPRVDGIGLETVGHRGRPARRRRRRAAARRRAAVGDRRHHRHLAADPCRQVRGRHRRGEHPRRAARGALRRGAARRLHRPAGGRGGRDGGAVQRDLRLADVAKTATYTRPTPSRTAS